MSREPQVKDFLTKNSKEIYGIVQPIFDSYQYPGDKFVLIIGTGRHSLHNCYPLFANPNDLGSNLRSICANQAEKGISERGRVYNEDDGIKIFDALFETTKDYTRASLFIGPDSDHTAITLSASNDYEVLHNPDGFERRLGLIARIGCGVQDYITNKFPDYTQGYRYKFNPEKFKETMLLDRERVLKQPPQGANEDSFFIKR